MRSSPLARSTAPKVHAGGVREGLQRQEAPQPPEFSHVAARPFERQEQPVRFVQRNEWVHSAFAAAAARPWLRRAVREVRRRGVGLRMAADRAAARLRDAACETAESGGERGCTRTRCTVRVGYLFLSARRLGV